MSSINKAHVYGDDINTDLIIAGKYTKTLNMAELASHCFEDIDANFTTKIKPGDWIVAGRNFGCGSSREQAPLAIKHSGIQGVIAKSFARIFYRNAINVGLLLVVCNTDQITDLDEISVDLFNGSVIINKKLKIPCEKLSPIMQQILEEGGLVPYLCKRGDF